MWEAPRGPLGQPHAPQAGDGACAVPSLSSHVVLTAASRVRGQADRQGYAAMRL